MNPNDSLNHIEKIFLGLGCDNIAVEKAKKLKITATINGHPIPTIYSGLTPSDSRFERYGSQQILNNIKKACLLNGELKDPKYQYCFDWATNYRKNLKAKRKVKEVQPILNKIKQKDHQVLEQRFGKKLRTRDRKRKEKAHKDLMDLGREMIEARKREDPNYFLQKKKVDRMLERSSLDPYGDREQYRIDMEMERLYGKER